MSVKFSLCYAQVYYWLNQWQIISLLDRYLTNKKNLFNYSSCQSCHIVFAVDNLNFSMSHRYIQLQNFKSKCIYAKVIQIK